MKTIQLVCAGFGGQGVLTVGQMIAIMAMNKGYQVSWMPSYGPEMRGGTANCQVVIDREEIASPIITEGITHLLAMNSPALIKFLPAVKAGGIVIVNSALVNHPIERTDVHVITRNFSQLATESGSPKVQNMVALGTLCKTIDFFVKEDGEQAIIDKFGKKMPELLEANLKAFNLGISE